MNKYIGHPSQLYSVREYRMCGGKADGMRMLEVNNGNGLSFVISLDRCADLTHVFFKGRNLAYIAPCGLVSPMYYDNEGGEFLKSFTAGFMTTCGLRAVGSPCVDDGENLPLHGNISHVPCEHHSWNVEDDCIRIKCVIRDASLFGHQMLLEREYVCGLNDNSITVNDKVTNISCRETPYMILYHCNMGYPLLSENCEFKINSAVQKPRDEHAAEGLGDWNKVTAPSDNFVEQCYYHEFSGEPCAEIFSPDINTGMKLTYDKNTLDCFTQWKMLGVHEYVMGLEPGNCNPDGRDVARENGQLKFLKPYESSENKLKFEFYKR